MGEALLSGSALAAFLAGLVAFFAPCCAFVMLPAYLASVTGARRWRTAGLTAVFIAGVATVVWPLTVGAAGLSQLIAANHETMFLVGGALMLLVGVATVRGWMWHHAPAAGGGGETAGVVSIYVLGVFSGAATACCAPVLAGAVAIAGVSGAWWVGALLGLCYLFGLVSPLVLSALGIERFRRMVHDPQLQVPLGRWQLRSTASRLAGGVMFVGLGGWLIGLALTGNARTAPTFQKAFGQWLTGRATSITSAVPFGFGWLLVLGLIGGVAYLGVRSMGQPRLPGDAVAAPPSCCEHEHSPSANRDMSKEASHGARP